MLFYLVTGTILLVVLSGYWFSLLFYLVTGSPCCFIWLQVLLVDLSGYSLLFYLVTGSPRCLFIWLLVLLVVLSCYWFSLLFYLVTGSPCFIWLLVLVLSGYWYSLVVGGFFFLQWGTADAEITTPPSPAVVGAEGYQWFLLIFKPGVGAYNMLCLLPGPLAYWCLPSRFILSSLFPP